MSSDEQRVELEALARTRLVLSTHVEREGEACDGRLTLRPDEGAILSTGPSPEG